VVDKTISINSRGSPCLSRSDVSIVLTLNISVLWDVTRCIEVNTLRRFELSLYISTLKMKEVRVFEKSGPVTADARRDVFRRNDSSSTFGGAVNRANKSCVI
jgi:hypothetical protein